MVRSMLLAALVLLLRVLADGIGSGRFPARPGEHQYHRGNFAHCAWCDFDAICPRDRDEEWERVRSHPSLTLALRNQAPPRVRPAGALSM